MKHTMRIITLLMLAFVVGTGQAWAGSAGPSNIKQGTVSNGSIEFYANEECTTSFNDDVAADAPVYIKATAASGYTAMGVTFTAKKGIGSDVIQAPRRIGFASDITVSPVDGKPGIYSFMMPEGDDIIVTVNANFVMPATQQVSYVDENYTTHENVNAYVLDETMSVLPAGYYVVPAGGLSLDHGIGSNGSSGVTIIIPDDKTLTVNGSFGMGCSLSFFGQTNATGKLTINTTTDGTNLGGRLTVAHVDITSDGGSLGGSNGCIFAGHQTKGNTVTVRSDGNSISSGNGVTIKYCNVDLVSESGLCITTGSSSLTVTGLADGSNTLKLRSKSMAISGGNGVTIKYCDVDIINESSNSTISCPYGVTIEGVATGNKVNTVIVRNDGSGFNTGQDITISYCNVEMTGTTKTGDVYDPCPGHAISCSGNVTITSRADRNNTVKVRCGGDTNSNSFGINSGSSVTISKCDVDVVSGGGYGIYTSGNVTITGGKVEVTGGNDDKGIYSGNGIITLGWINATDYIRASSYFVSDIKAMKTADGQRFVAYNDALCTEVSTIVSGSTSDTNATFTIDGIAGKTLKPFEGIVVSTADAQVTLSGAPTHYADKNATHYYIYGASAANTEITLGYNGTIADGKSVAYALTKTGTDDEVGLTVVANMDTDGKLQNTQGKDASFTLPAYDVTIATTINPFPLPGGYCGNVLYDYSSTPTEITADYSKNVWWSVSDIDNVRTVTIGHIDGDNNDIIDVGTPWRDYNATVAVIPSGMTNIGELGRIGQGHVLDDVKLILVDNMDAYRAYMQNANYFIDGSQKSKFAPKTFDITVPKGWGTYCQSYPVSYSLSTGSTAYTISSIENNAVSVDAVDHVSTYTPLLINNNSESEVVTLTAVPSTAGYGIGSFIPCKQEGTGYNFYGNAVDKELTNDVIKNNQRDENNQSIDYIFAIGASDAYQSYVLYNGVFYAVDDASAGIAGHRCWLNVAKPITSAPRLSIVQGDGEMTGIDSISTESGSQGVFGASAEGNTPSLLNSLDRRNLSGQRVGAGYKGIVIVNGRKVVIK